MGGCSPTPPLPRGVQVSEERQRPAASPRRVDLGAGGADKVSGPFTAYKAGSETFRPQGAVLIAVCAEPCSKSQVFSFPLLDTGST